MRPSTKPKRVYGLSAAKTAVMVNTIAPFSPQKDFVSFDHVSQDKVLHGNAKVTLASSQAHLFDCTSELDYLDTKTGEVYKVFIDYVTVKKQSVNLTLIELDAVVKCYETDVIKLQSAKSVLRPLQDFKLAKLAKELGQPTTDHIVISRFLDERTRDILESA